MEWMKVLITRIKFLNLIEEKKRKNLIKIEENKIE